MNVYEEWLQASAELTEAKQKELLLRNAICEVQLEDKVEGARTETIDGYKITATAKLTRSVDVEMLEAIREDLTDQEAECIKYTPSVKMANYKVLEQANPESILLDAITVKPATPALKIVKIEEE